MQHLERNKFKLERDSSQSYFPININLCQNLNMDCVYLNFGEEITKLSLEYLTHLGRINIRLNISFIEGYEEMIA
jgi:hypothetical protein